MNTQNYYDETGSGMVDDYREELNEIAAAEHKLAESGLRVYAAGKSAEFARVKLGTAGATKSGVVPILLRIAGGTKAKAAWAAAVDRLALDSLMGRIARSWTEQGDTGAEQHFLGLDLGGFADLDTAWHIATSGLAAWKALTPAGSPLASLIVTQAAVAPSVVDNRAWAITAGSTGSLTMVTVSELLGLGAALNEVSAVADATSKLAYTSRGMIPRTNAARDHINRSVAGGRITKALRRAGWTEIENAKLDVSTVAFAAPGAPNVTAAYVGGPLLPRGGMLTVDGAELPLGFEPSTAYRPFDVLSMVELEGKAFPGDWDLTAERMLASGEAMIETEIYQAGTIVDVNIADRTLDAAGQIVKAISRARAKHDTSLPLVIQRAIPGSTEKRQLLSVTPSGGLKTWASPDGLMLAAVQMVKIGAIDKDTGERRLTTVHSIPSAIAGLVEGSLVEPGGLPAAEYIGTEPMITAKGEVVSEHGFHPAEKMLLGIPENQRAAWAKVQVDRPTKADAQASLDYLRAELCVDFPFATYGDEARFLAFLLTAVARPITEQCPLIIANGSEVGTGKSLTMLLVRMIASGNSGANAWTGGKNGDIEDVKSLVTGALEAYSRVWMHNDEASQGAGRDGRLESAMVTRFTTQLDGEGKQRVLGVSGSVEVAGSIFTAAGNGIKPGGDLARRTLVYTMRINTGVLAVERKGFHHTNIVGWVRNNRPLVLQHIFTILAHGIQNPVDVPSYGFTGAWPRIILGALDHLTMNEQNAHLLVMDSMAEQMAGNKQSEEWGPLISGLSEITSGTTFEASSARLWADQFRLEVPERLRFLKATNDTGLNKSWSGALKTMVNEKVTNGDYRYRLTEVVEGKKTKRFKIERFDEKGDADPEVGTAKPKPTAASVRERQFEESGL